MIGRLLILSILFLFFRGLLEASPVNGHIQSTTGDPVLVTTTGKLVPITRGMVIPEGSKIQTDAHSTVVINWLPGASSMVSTNTTVAVASLNYTKSPAVTGKGQITLALLQGSISNHLLHNDGSYAFITYTPQGVVNPTGNYWLVTCPPPTKAVAVGAATLTVPPSPLLSTVTAPLPTPEPTLASVPPTSSSVAIVPTTAPAPVPSPATVTPPVLPTTVAAAAPVVVPAPEPTVVSVAPTTYSVATVPTTEATSVPSTQTAATILPATTPVVAQAATNLKPPPVHEVKPPPVHEPQPPPTSP